MTVPGVFDDAVGDLWRVTAVGSEGVTLEREELQRVREAMDAAMDSAGRFMAQRAPFLPPDQVGPELQRALNQGWASVAERG